MGNGGWQIRFSKLVFCQMTSRIKQRIRRGSFLRHLSAIESCLARVRLRNNHGRSDGKLRLCQQSGYENILRILSDANHRHQVGSMTNVRWLHLMSAGNELLGERLVEHHRKLALVESGLRDLARWLLDLALLCLLYTSPSPRDRG